ncbi:hypothetical protein A8C56_09185 [Niabella ginsenosidivorans]|uniref:Uncharacterized protein n=1 Tax=Niabella ginsenosidivorans TaxID=1176587 RepID=A0A1A9I0E2_9BACT|nr:hypothetical protein A8C56_09185 [Niabella ginsenosidivorans]
MEFIIDLNKALRLNSQSIKKFLKADGSIFGYDIPDIPGRTKRKGWCRSMFPQNAQNSTDNQPSALPPMAEVCVFSGI